MTRLLKLREVGQQLGVSLSTVERLVASGAFRGSVIRFGGNTRIAAEAVNAFIGAHADVSPTTGPLLGDTAETEARHVSEVASDDGEIPSSAGRSVVWRETTAAEAIARACRSGRS